MQNHILINSIISVFFLLTWSHPMLGQNNYRIINEEDPIAVEIQKIIFYDTPINENQTPGMLIGIIDGDSSWVWQYGTEQFNGSNKIPINASFEVGSVTKSMVTAVLSRLLEMEKLDWDLSINELLPEDCKNDLLESISINDLVTHQSGLAKYTAFIGEYENEANGMFENYTKSDLCNYISELKRLGSKKEIYSHLNFAILELGLEHFLSMPMIDICNQYLFKDLALENTSFEVDSHLAIGHTKSLKESRPYNFSSFAGSEGIKTDLNDLMKFCRWQMGIGDQALAESAADLTIPQGKSNFDKEIYVSRGWHLVKTKKKQIILMQTGISDGHHASISLLPKTKTGVIVLSNSSFGSYDLAFLILRMINYNFRKNG